MFLVDYAHVHPALAYGLVGAAALAEALPVLGALVPGDVIILGIGALVPTGAVGLWPLILAATVGAVIGDGLSFGLGRHYREALLGRWPIRGHLAWVARGEEFSERHGGKSVFIARFTPGMRAIVPTLSGMLRMSPARFYTMNVLSAVIWAPLHVVAGAAIGAALVLLGAVAGRLAMLVAIVLALAALVIWGTRAVARRVPPRVAAAADGLRRWALRRDSVLRRSVLAFLDPARRELPGLALLASILVASLWLFLGVLQDVLAGDPLVRANEAVLHFMQSLRIDAVDRVMVAITELGDPSVVTAVAFAALLWFAVRRNGRAAAHAAGAVGLSAALTFVVKSALRTSRPFAPDAAWQTFAFPSGHSAVNAALYGFLAIVAAWGSSKRTVFTVAGAASLLVAAIAFSRIYLGLHWLSDVLAGIAFGTAWAAFLAIAYLRRNPPRIGAGGLCAFTGAALLVAGGWHIDRSHREDMVRYAVQERSVPMRCGAWWRSRWAELPARRRDLEGESGAALTFQWAGSVATLARDLAGRGWTKPTPWTVRSTLAWLRPHVPIAHLPVLPRLEDGREQALVRTLPVGGASGDSRFVLRVWRSSVEITGLAGGSVPLLVGMVEKERIDRSVAFVTMTHSTPDYGAGLEALAAAMPLSRRVVRADEARQPGWRGRVILGRSGPAPSGLRPGS